VNFAIKPLTIRVKKYQLNQVIIIGIPSFLEGKKISKEENGVRKIKKRSENIIVFS